MREEARLWFAQARAVRDQSERAMRDGAWFLVAWLAHQYVEMLLKALYLQLRATTPLKTHNLRTLGVALGAAGSLLDDLVLLNPEYATSRYPDAANGVPAENYTRAKAQMLVDAAERIWSWGVALLPAG